MSTTLTTACWRAIEDPPWWEASVGEVLASNAAQWGDRPGVIWLDPAGEVRSMSWRELLATASVRAGDLLNAASPGDRVVVWAPNSVHWIVAEYACALAGLVLVPANPNGVDGELAHLLTAVQPAVILSVADHRGSSLLERARAQAGSLEGPPAVLDLETMAIAPEGPPPELAPVAPDAPFLIQPTSGTTGTPKCAMHTHRGLVNCARFQSLGMQQNEEDVWLTPVPYYHVGGSVCMALGALTVGAALVVVPVFDPAAVIELIGKTRPTLFSGVPTMLFDMLRQPGFRKESVERLRTVISGGAAVPPSMIREVEETLGARVVVGYGQSESPNITMTALDDSDEEKAETLGRPNAYREVKIVSDAGATLGIGEVGELWTRSEMSMQEYVGLPEETARVLDAEGWLHTGDLCSMESNGIVRFHGRRRDLIIRGGQNVYPEEVEHVLLRHPAVGQVAVLGVPDARLGEEVAAVVVPEMAASGVEVEALERHARDALARYKVPRHWSFAEELPLTASGKVKKFELREALSRTPR